MYWIFLDNYRGFQESFTPLAPVTFFVGENSTGKSSFLSAIQLLSSFDFWTVSNFNSGVIKLGAFDDIVSISSKDRSRFSMGWASLFIGEDYKSAAFYLLDFEDQDGTPRLRKISFLNRNAVFDVQFSDDTVSYARRFVDESIFEPEPFFELIQDAATRLAEPIENGSEIDQNIPLQSSRAAFFLPRILDQDDLDESWRQSRPLLFSTDNLLSLAPIRTQPESIYQAVEPAHDAKGTYAPYALRRAFSDPATGNRLKEKLAVFGANSTLFKDIAVHNFGTERSPSGSGLPFEVNVILEDKPINLPFVGYGVSQVLPIAIDAILGREEQEFIVQQPEVHLHPRAQAAVGDLIYELALADQKRFFVETHSDFLIDRFRLRMSQNQDDEDSPGCCVNFFQRKNGFNDISCIPVDDDGKISDEQPPEFRSFFVNEQLSLLKV